MTGNILEHDGEGWVGLTVPLAEAMLKAEQGDEAAAAEVERMTGELESPTELRNAEALAQFLREAKFGPQAEPEVKPLGGIALGIDLGMRGEI